jgi:predicted ATPase
MPDNCARFIVITGGPGSGKTTLLDALRSMGFATSPEAGRGIIKAQQAIGGRALPWRDPALFAELMLSWDIRSHVAGQAAPGAVFFDRGIPDTIGYLKLTGLPVPPRMLEAAKLYRYRPRVLIAPPWPEIFSPDAERRQDFDEAVSTHAAMAGIYSSLGYELVSLPLAPVDERVRFVLAETGACS